MKRKILIAAAIILAVILILTIGLSIFGRRPFKDMNADDIQSISIHLWPPNETLELTRQEIEELVGILQQAPKMF